MRQHSSALERKLNRQFTRPIFPAGAKNGSGNETTLNQRALLLHANSSSRHKNCRLRFLKFNSKQSSTGGYRGLPNKMLSVCSTSMQTSLIIYHRRPNLEEAKEKLHIVHNISSGVIFYYFRTLYWYCKLSQCQRVLLHIFDW